MTGHARMRGRRQAVRSQLHKVLGIRHATRRQRRINHRMLGGSDILLSWRRYGIRLLRRLTSPPFADIAMLR